jgi:peptidoglycan/xylan/chitin deacetylase (PgdA/CDA1 family)
MKALVSVLRVLRSSGAPCALLLASCSSSPIPLQETEPVRAVAVVEDGQGGQRQRARARAASQQQDPRDQVPLASVVPVAGDGGAASGMKLSYSSVVTSQPCVALTFDDGPHPQLTARLLDLLAQRSVPCTFFVVGRNARAYPQLIRRMVAEGHEVASHTDTHPVMTKLSDQAIVEELERTEKAIVAASQVKPTLIRPPYGATNDRVRRLVRSRFGYLTIMWSVDPLDWKRPGPAVVASRLVAGARPGAILLAHDIHAGTIDAMPATIDELLKRGFRFVTVSQLLAQQGVVP